MIFLNKNNSINTFDRFCYRKKQLKFWPAEGEWGHQKSSLTADNIYIGSKQHQIRKSNSQKKVKPFQVKARNNQTIRNQTVKKQSNLNPRD